MTPGQGRPPVLDVGWTAALCAGVLAQLFAPALLPHGAAWLLLAAAVATGLAAWRVAMRASSSALAVWGPRLASLAAFGLGAALCGLQGHHAMERRLPAAMAGLVLPLDVRILDLPDHRPTGSRFTATVVGVPGARTDLVEALQSKRITLDWHGAGHRVHPGEIWRLTVRLRPWSRPRNPGDPDEGRRALIAGVDAQGVVPSGVRPLRFGTARGLHARRGLVSEAITEALGAPAARFVAALAVGDTRGLSDADWERLRQFGLTHLVAISGFHVGMVAGLGVLLVRVVWWLAPSLARRLRRRPAAALAAVLVATAYAALAGFSLPTVRTVLMVGAVAAMVGLRRRTPRAQPLLLAVVALVLADPFALLTPGFWLSCGGVAWLLWCLPGMSNPWSVLDFLKAQWVATLGLLPLGAVFFLQVPIAGPVANLVGIPWISLVVVPLSLLGTALMPVSDTLSALAWQAAAHAMDVFWTALGHVPEAGSSSRWLAEPSPAAIGLALLGVAIVLLPRGVRWRPAGALLVLPLLFPSRAVPPDGEFTVTTFALPRGDALLVETATRRVLVDAGPADFDLARRLRASGVGDIDLRIETRRNAGRIGGAAAIDRAFAPAARWVAPGSGLGGPGSTGCSAGKRWSVDGVHLEAVAPDPWASGPSGDEACVLRVRSASGRVAWLVSDTGRWVAHRLAAPTDRAWVFGAPAALADWHSALTAEGAIASRAPGPSLSKRWPTALHRVDRDGAVVWHSQATVSSISPLRGGVRWWFPAP